MPNATVRANARTLPKVTAHHDAAIFDLAEECIAAAKVRDETGAVFDKAEKRCRGCLTPPVIIRTERDKQLGLYVGNRVGRKYDRGDIPALRAFVRDNSWISDATRPEEIEAYLRAEKILNALLDLRDEEAREGIESGLTDATRRYHAASDAYDHLAERLLAMPAQTLEGAFAKVRVFSLHFSGNVDENLRERLRIMGEEHETVALSLARDLIRLANGEPAK